MVNTWWTGDGAERYWMEITDRPDVGTDLNAPQRDGAGRENWTYTLVTWARPGDVVFHWHTDWSEHSAIIGWSEVVGPLEEIDPYTWLAHGTRGRARGVPTVGRGWRMPCANFTELERPVDAVRLNALRAEILQLADNLKKQHGTTYFPFSRYGDTIRAAQAYLTKFPAGLLQLLPEVRNAFIYDAANEPLTQGRRRGAGRLLDPALRKAIEEHAVERARQYYLNLGATDIVVLGKPFDLLVRGLSEEIHVEVKGSSVTSDKVALTSNEVIHANTYSRTDLFVVDQISFAATDGKYSTSGGRDRVWEMWRPSPSDLSATQYQYRLPPR